MQGAATLWWHQEWIWSAISTGIELLLLASVPTSILLYRLDERNKFYLQLDDIYRRILEMVVENPNLPKPLVNSKKNAKYDAFAFIVWNFLETIHDYCRDNDRLMKTWRPILAAESEVHAEWFNRRENRLKFKDEFCAYMVQREWEQPRKKRLSRWLNAITGRTA